jgi:tRNA-dihydrouridine synthase
VRDFVGTVAEAGCEVFIVHARNAWLQGLSPKENREIPPLRYELATASSGIFRTHHRGQRRHHHQRADRRAPAALWTA